MVKEDATLIWNKSLISFVESADITEQEMKKFKQQVYRKCKDVENKLGEAPCTHQGSDGKKCYDCLSNYANSKMLEEMDAIKESNPEGWKKILAVTNEIIVQFKTPPNITSNYNESFQSLLPVCLHDRAKIAYQTGLEEGKRQALEENERRRLDAQYFSDDSIKELDNKKLAFCLKNGSDEEKIKVRYSLAFVYTKP
jgi:hypothetical protein